MALPYESNTSHDRNPSLGKNLFSISILLRISSLSLLLILQNFDFLLTRRRKMSFFLEILRCILCCGEEDDRRYYRIPKSDISREYSHHETMLRGSSYSLSSSYDTLGVKRRTNRDDWNSGTVNSIACGSVKTSPVNRPRVTETPLRLPLNPSPPKVTQKLTCMPLLPSPPSVQHNKLVDSAVNGKRTITAEQETSKCSQANGHRGTNNLATAPPVAVFSNNGLVKNPLLSSNKAVICSYGSVNSPVIPPTVNSNSFGSVKKSPVNPPTVAQTPLRLPPTPLSPKVTLKPICLSPLPSPLSVHRKNPVDSTVNEKTTITAEQETIKSTPAKGNEGSRTGNNLAPTSSASFSQHSSEAFLSSNKPVICSSGPLQCASKPLLSSSGPLSSASKATAASLKASPSSQGPQPSASGPTLSLPPSPVQNGSIPVFAENIEYLISTGSRPSSSEWVRSPKSGLVPSPSSDASNLPKGKKWDQVQRGKTLTFAKTEDSKNLVQPPFSPDSLPTATNSPKSTPKLPPFPYELPSASKGTRSPTPCPLDKTNPAKKTKLVWVRKDTTPISSTNKVIKNWITLPQSFPSDSDSDSDSPPSSPILSPSSNGTSPFSSMPSPAPFGPANPPKRNTYFLHEGATLIYEIPEDIKILIKRDIVPVVLKEPLSPLTYKDYFATLLYAEDFYVEKWSKFCLKNVTLELEEASVYIKSKKSLNDSDEKEERLFVVFEINLIPERRPFLLSRDFVFLRPAGKKVEPFKGILHQVVKRNRVLSEFDDYHVMKRDIVLAEFDDDFHLQHLPDFKYDVSFSFNRFCLKRSHQAIAAATELLFQNFLFPVQMYRTTSFVPPFISSHQNLDWDQISAVQQILMLRDSPPYLIDGPLSLTGNEDLSRTALVIREAVLQIYKSSPGCRILVSAPTNKTCDRLVESLDDEIPELDMFRANAAFREIDVVPGDILPLCQYEGECFTCPPLEKLKNFKVIFSTFMSSFRLHNEGLPAGHFSHIFLVDASSAMEPEALVVLTNLVDENTNVVVTGASGNSSKWVRSDIGRRYGLKKSYFQRLLESKPYVNQDSMFVTNLWA